MVRIKKIQSDNEEIIELSDSLSQAIDLLSQGVELPLGTIVVDVVNDTVGKTGNIYVCNPGQSSTLTVRLQRVGTQDQGRVLVVRNNDAEDFGSEVVVVPEDINLTINGFASATLFSDSSAMFVPKSDKNWIMFPFNIAKDDGYGSVTPSAHVITHQNGGLDELNVDLLTGLLADPQVPLAHKVSHQAGGSDEINVVGLSGLLADGQTPLTHKLSHQSGGGDSLKLDDLATPDDNTDLNSTTTEHGLLKKLNNDATSFLNGQGNWVVPIEEIGSVAWGKIQKRKTIGVSIQSFGENTWEKLGSDHVWDGYSENVVVDDTDCLLTIQTDGYYAVSWHTEILSSPDSLCKLALYKNDQRIEESIVEGNVFENDFNTVIYLVETDIIEIYGLRESGTGDIKFTENSLMLTRVLLESTNYALKSEYEAIADQAWSSAKDAGAQTVSVPASGTWYNLDHDSSLTAISTKNVTVATSGTHTFNKAGTYSIRVIMTIPNTNAGTWSIDWRKNGSVLTGYAVVITEFDPDPGQYTMEWYSTFTIGDTARLVVQRSAANTATTFEHLNCTVSTQRIGVT